MKEDISIKYVVTAGAEPDTILYPHKHNNGKYVASMSRFKKDYIYVDTLRELSILAKYGFSIRMSNKNTQNHNSPSLISPSSLIYDRLEV